MSDATFWVNKEKHRLMVAINEVTGGVEVFPDQRDGGVAGAGDEGGIWSLDGGLAAR